MLPFDYVAIFLVFVSIIIVLLESGTKFGYIIACLLIPSVVIYFLIRIVSKRKRDNELDKINKAIKLYSNEKGIVVTRETFEKWSRKNIEEIDRAKIAQYKLKSIKSKLIECVYCCKLRDEKHVKWHLKDLPVCNYCYSKRAKEVEEKVRRNQNKFFDEHREERIEHSKEDQSKQPIGFSDKTNKELKIYYDKYRKKRIEQKIKDRSKKLEQQENQILKINKRNQENSLRKERDLIQEKNVNRGYVYIFINASLEKNVIKIGRTNRNPTVRAKELSDQTGLPSEFIVAYDREVLDCEKAEIMIHDKLKKYRITDSRKDRNREFFRIPLKKAIGAIDEIVKEINSI